MAYSGQVLDNPMSGERIVLRKTAADTGSVLLAFELVLTPDGHVRGTHVHPAHEERFEVVRGTLPASTHRSHLATEREVA